MRRQIGAAAAALSVALVGGEKEMDANAILLENAGRYIIDCETWKTNGPANEKVFKYYAAVSEPHAPL
jgi:hypothetical protein